MWGGASGEERVGSQAEGVALRGKPLDGYAARRLSY